jgi:hypothetical protein
MLVEVSGDLPDAAVVRWAALLNGAIAERPTVIAVDLRGCPWIDPICSSALLAASSTLRARGGDGVRLVMYPDSPLDLELGELVVGELPVHDSVSEALLAVHLQ